MTEAVSKERTRNYLRQIKGAVIYRSVAMLASFLAIPLMIHYLGQDQYGVWSTLLTVMTWMVFFDLGVGNGLRNKVSEALAKEETKEAAAYISSAYTLIGLISLAIWAISTVASYFIPWQVVFNTEAISELALRETFQIAVFFVVLNFWIGLISALLSAVQKTALVAFGQLVTNLLMLVFVYFLTRATNPSITKLAITYGVSILTANIAISLLFYRGHRELRPQLIFDKNHLGPLLNLGLQFFSIQFAVLIIFTTDKMLITQLFGPQYIAQYDVLFKIFSLVNFAHALISTPLWSAYTDSYHRGDLRWIRRMLRHQLIIFTIICASVILIALASKSLINIWIGNDFDIANDLILAMGILTIVSAWNNVFGTIVGGIGKLRLGSIYTMITAAINLPISYYLAINFELGISGVVFGSVLSIMVSSIISPIQVYYFVYCKNRSSKLNAWLR